MRESFAQHLGPSLCSPGLAAVASPLPATIPGAAPGALAPSSGVLANGGGYLLVPLYLLVLGLRMRQASGTSLLVVAFLAIPTLATHWALGHIDWTVAGPLALGLIPSSVIASRHAQRVEGPTLRRAFGVFLVLFGLSFTVYRLVHG
jgi:uncharacterized protein